MGAYWLQLLQLVLAQLFARRDSCRETSGSLVFPVGAEQIPVFMEPERT